MTATIRVSTHGNESVVTIMGLTDWRADPSGVCFLDKPDVLRDVFASIVARLDAEIAARRLVTEHGWPADETPTVVADLQIVKV